MAQGQSSNEISFGAWFYKIRYYFAKKLDDKRERQKQEQFEKVENSIHDDARFIAARKGIPVYAARDYYENMLDSLSLELKKDGNEEGLNKVVGYSLEKYKVTKDLLLPLKAEGTELERSYPVPNGMLLYGPANTGKTHFANALGEHIEKMQLGEFREFHADPSDLAADDPMALLNFFEEAEERYRQTGERQILFFDNLDYMIDDEDNPNIKGIFLYKSKNCAKNGVTWLATTNNSRCLPDAIYKKSRLNSDIYINKTSGAEKSAVMSYFWKQRNRQDDSDHSYLLDRNESSFFHFYPPEIEEVSLIADKNIEAQKDRKSRLTKDVTVRRPVKTVDVNNAIYEYLTTSGNATKAEDVLMYAEADEQPIYVANKRGRI